MQLIDTHAHVYDKQFKNELADYKERCQISGVEQVLLPNIDSNSIQGVKDLITDPFYQPMMGLHPCSVKSDYKAELDAIEKALDTLNCCAVGEIGLDYYWDTTHKAEQIDAFEIQIQWAKERNLPIAIHARDAFEDIISILETHADEKLKGVLHCFTSHADHAKRLVDIGFYLGIGGVVTFKNGGLDKVLPEVPLNHLVLETDAPYLAPVPYRGKRNESSYLNLIAARIAEIKEIPVAKVATQTTKNAKLLFNLK